MSRSSGNRSREGRRTSGLLNTMLSRVTRRRRERDDLALAAMDDRLTVGAAPADHHDRDGDRAAD